MDTIPLTREFTLEHLPSFIRLSAQLEGDYWSSEHYISDLNRKWELSKAIVEGNQLIGFLIASEKPEYLHIHRIVIDRSFHGKGFAKILITDLLEEARTLNKNGVSLKVNNNNSNAIAAYQKMNFRELDTTGEYYHLVLDI